MAGARAGGFADTGFWALFWHPAAEINIPLKIASWK
jgi:hypothetical protein